MARKGSVKLSILSSYDGKGTDQAEKALEKFAKRYGAISKENGQTKVALDSTTRALAEMSLAFDQASQKWDGYSKKAAAVGKAFAPISGAAAAVAGASIKMASDYEQGLAKVATIADKTQVPVAELGKSMLSLSNDTGKAVTEVEEATYQAISASVETRDAVGFVGKAINLAKAGFTDTTTAVDVLTTTINAYGMSADDAEKISDKLVQTQNKGKTSVNELGQNLGQVIPTAAAYGVSLDNLLTSYVQLTKQGINTANSTTYINRMLTELADSGSDVAGILKDKTGKSFDELMKDGASLGDVMDILMDSVDGNKTAFANLWGSAVAGKGALAIANAGAEDFNGQMLDMADCTGNVENALNDLQTPAGKANKAINSLKNTGIQLGEVYLAALMPAATRLAEEAANLFKRFESLDDETKTNIATAIALAAAITPTAMAFSKLFGIISGGFGLMGSFTGWLARGSAALTANASKANMTRAAYVAMNAPMKLASVGLSAVKTAGAGLAVVLAGMLIKSIVDSVRHMQDMDKATNGLRGGTDTMAASIEGAGKAVDSASGSYEAYGVSVSDALSKQARLVDSLNDIANDAASSQAELEAYCRVVEELGGKGKLTAGEQARLQTAVDKLNQSLGTSIEVTDAATGALSEETQTIRQLVEQQKEKIRVEALQQQMSELYKQQTTDAQALSDALHKANDVAKQHGLTYDEMVSEYQKGALHFGEYIKEVDEARALYDATADKIADLDAQIENHIDTLDGAAGSVQSWVNANQDVSMVLGQQAQDFAQACGDMGVEVSALEGVNRDKLLQMLSMWDGSGDELRGILSTLGVDMKALGKESAEGYAEGIDKGAPEAEKAAEAMAEDATEAAEDATDGKSAGEKMDSTYAKAVKAKTKEVSKAASDMAQKGASSALKSSDNSAGGKRTSDTYRKAIGSVVAKAQQMATDGKNAAYKSSDNSQGGKKTSDTYRNAIGSVTAKAAQMATDAKNSAHKASDNSAGGKRVSDTYRNAIGSATAKAASMATDARKSANDKSDNSSGGKKVSDTYRNAIGSATAKASGMANDARNSAYNASNASAGGSHLSGTYAGGISKNAGNSAASTMGNNAKSAAKVSGYDSGRFMGNGFVSGIASTVSSAVAQARSLASQAIAAVKRRGGEGSPWKTTMESGKFMAQGLAVGIADGASGVEKASRALAASTIDSMMDELEIESPSKKAQKKVGKQVSAGVAVGIVSNKKLATNAGKELGYAVTQGIDANGPAVSKAFDSLTETMKDKAKKASSTYSATAKSTIATFTSGVTASLKASETTMKSTWENWYNAQVKANETQQKKLQSKISSIDKKYSAKISKASKKSTKEALRKERDAAKKPYQTQLNSLKAQTDTLKKSYKSLGTEVVKAYSTAVENATKGATDKLAKNLQSIADAAQAKIDEVNKLIEDMRSKLVDYGALFNRDEETGAITLESLQEQTKAIKQYGANLEKLKGKVSQNLLDAISGMDIQDGLDYTNALLKKSAKDLAAYDKAYTAKVNAAKSVSSAFYGNQVEEIRKNYSDQVTAELNRAKGEIEAIGKQTMQGFVNGMKGVNWSKEVKSIADSIVKDFKKTLKIKSPSRVFMGIGENTGEGYVIGFGKKADEAEKSARDMARRVADAAEVAPRGNGWGMLPSGGVKYVQRESTGVENLTAQIASLLQEVEGLHGELGRIIASNAPVVVESERDFARRVNRAVNL